MISVDLFANDTADENVTVDPKDDVVVQEQKILESVGKLLGAEKLDAILNMAGKIILIWLNFHTLKQYPKCLVMLAKITEKHTFWAIY